MVFCVFRGYRFRQRWVSFAWNKAGFDLSFKVPHRTYVKFKQSRNCVLVRSAYLINWKFGLTDAARNQCSYFIIPESIRKPEVFCCFQGIQNDNIGQKRVYCCQLVRLLIIRFCYLLPLII